MLSTWIRDRKGGEAGRQRSINVCNKKRENDLWGLPKDSVTVGVTVSPLILYSSFNIIPFLVFSPLTFPSNFEFSFVLVTSAIYC